MGLMKHPTKRARLILALDLLRCRDQKAILTLAYNWPKITPKSLATTTCGELREVLRRYLSDDILRRGRIIAV